MKDIELAFYAGQIIEGKLYFFSEFFQELFLYNINDKRIEWLNIDIDKNGFEELKGIKRAIVFEDNIYFWGILGIGYYKYDIKKRMCTYQLYMKNIYTAEIILEDYSNIIIPTNKPWDKIFRFNMRKDEFEIINADITRIKSLNLGPDAIVQNSVCIKNIIYFPIVHSEIVITFDLLSNKFDYFIINGSVLYGITNYKDNIIFSQFGTYNYILYDLINKKANCVHMKGNFQIENDIPYYARIFVNDSSLFFLPESGKNKITVVDLEKNKIRMLDYPKGFELNKKERYLYSFYGYEKYGNSEYVYQLSSNMMLEIKENMELQGHRLVVSDDYKQKAYECILKKQTVNENREIDLETFLSIIQ